MIKYDMTTVLQGGRPLIFIEWGGEMPVKSRLWDTMFAFVRLS